MLANKKNLPDEHTRNSATSNNRIIATMMGRRFSGRESTMKQQQHHPRRGLVTGTTASRTNSIRTIRPHRALLCLLLVLLLLVVLVTPTRSSWDFSLRTRQRPRRQLQADTNNSTTGTELTPLEQLQEWIDTYVTLDQRDICHIVSRSNNNNDNTDNNSRVVAKATTVTVSSWLTIWLHLWLHPHDVRGDCAATACSQVCLSIDENTCGVVVPDSSPTDCFCQPMDECELDALIETEDAVDCISDSTICDDLPFTECVVVEQVASCECQVGFAPSTLTGECVLKCTNPGGNPCGPNSACADDDEEGFTCTSLSPPSFCPVGCVPQTEECVNGTCECKPGFVQTDPFLPCKAV